MEYRPGREPVEVGGDPVDPPGAAGDANDGDAREGTDERAVDEPAGSGEAGSTGSGDREDTEPGDAPGRDPRRFNDWRKRSATGVVMTGIALGLREALELPDQRPALVIEAPGEPEDPDRPIDLHFDPDDPAATVAVVRHRDDGNADGGRRRP